MYTTCVCVYIYIIIQSLRNNRKLCKRYQTKEGKILEAKLIKY